MWDYIRIFKGYVVIWEASTGVSIQTSECMTLLLYPAYANVPQLCGVQKMLQILVASPYHLSSST